MFRPIKVIDVELSRPIESIERLDGYNAVLALVRLHGSALGCVRVPLTNQRCEAQNLCRAIREKLGWPLLRHLLNDGLSLSFPKELRLETLGEVPHPEPRAELPLVTVAVCTRDRADDLASCLDALTRLDYPALDLLVVDNAPTINATERLVRTRYPNVRYALEPRPGLNWARNRAILEARGEIIAYTDDDVIVDPNWAKALATVFAEDPGVMAVTGLVIPYELETEAQWLFEHYGGFGRGFIRQWFRVDPRSGQSVARWHGGTGKFGTGANMAYRRSLLERIGLFDPALDVGTVTNGGGDLEMFFRMLKEGCTLVYEPDAIVRHRHRRDYTKLRTQIANNGVGFYSYLVRSALAYPDERFNFFRLGVWWLWWWNLRRLLISFVQPLRLPRELNWAELRGSFAGLTRYRQARRNAAQIASRFGPQAPNLPASPRPSPIQRVTSNPAAVRSIDVSQPIPALTDVADYGRARIFVTWKEHLLGSFEIANERQPVSRLRLCQAITDYLHIKLVEPGRALNAEHLWTEVLARLAQRFAPIGEEGPTRLPSDISVSIVLATRDRPDDLHDCLRALTAQNTSRRVEIVVVDNNPASGLTSPVVAEFPNVVLVNERRKGLSYARNAGIAVSTGEIIIATDDDVTMPPDWLEKLVAPFVQPDVMIVTGNVLPVDLETTAQQLFEAYGGLGRGFKPLEADAEWFEQFRFRAVPTWELGATANAAFRAGIFCHPHIGQFDESLGVGTPTGCSEDTYLFYKVLKAGYRIVYASDAYVWHRHRRDLPALRRQIYSYSKGHVAYQLMTLFRDRDLRALVRLAYELPKVHLWRIRERLRGRSDYPLSLVWLEMAGNLAGAWALWRSRRRVKREGRSAPYVPFSQRHPPLPEAALPTLSVSPAQSSASSSRGGRVE